MLLLVEGCKFNLLKNHAEFMSILNLDLKIYMAPIIPKNIL